MPDLVPARGRPLSLVVMGVTASGKSTVGALLAKHLSCPFIDGDDLHSPENIAKMSAGQALNDLDRRPWLDRVAAALNGFRASGTGGVVSCSALKARYRVLLAPRCDAFVYLAESPESILRRVAERTDHFMSGALVESQFQALEAPEWGPGVIVSQSARSPEARCAEILVEIGRLGYGAERS